MFWKGVVGYLPANIVQGLVGLATIVAFTRLLTPGEFGDYALGYAAMTLVHTLAFTWNEAAMARFWVGESDAGRGRAHAASVYGVFALALVLPLAAAGVTVLLPLPPGLKLALVCGLLAIPPRAFAKLAQERRRAAGDVSGAALIDIVQSLGAFLVGAGLAVAGVAGGAAPLIGFGVAALACTLACFAAETALWRGGRLEPARVRAHAGYGVPVAASLILALVLATTDRFLLAAFLDAEAVGVYHAGYSLANRTLDVVFVWLGAAGAPALVAALERGGLAALVPSAREQASLMLALTLPAAVGLALVAEPLAGLMVGAELAAGAAQVTPWIAASGLLAGLTTYYFHQAFTLGQRTPLLLAAMAIPAGANLALNLILIPRFGLTGALAATVASYGLGLVASIALGRRALALPIPWRASAELAAATGLMAAVVAALPDLGGLAELALKSGVGGVVFILTAGLLDAGGFRSRGLALARRRIGREATA